MALRRNLEDLTDYQSSLASPGTRPGGGKLLFAWIRQKRVAVPGILILVVLGSLLGWLVHRQARVRWAREQALPEISRLIDEERFITAFAMGQEAEKYIPTDPTLNKLLSSMSFIRIHSHDTSSSKGLLQEYSAVGENGLIWVNLHLRTSKLLGVDSGSR